MTNNDTINITGVLEMVFKDQDGNIVDSFKENNIVLNQGKDVIIKAFTTKDTNNFTVKTLRIGSDVGASGDILDPSAPTADLTENDMEVVYESPQGEFFIEYPTFNSVRFLTTLNGANVMAQYPSQPNVIYTSACLITETNKAITYRRFSAKTLSSLISVDIIWTLVLS